MALYGDSKAIFLKCVRSDLQLPRTRLWISIYSAASKIPVWRSSATLHIASASGFLKNAWNLKYIFIKSSGSAGDSANLSIFTTSMTTLWVKNAISAFFILYGTCSLSRISTRGRMLSLSLYNTAVCVLTSLATFKR